jgi:hypothetical protein
MPIKAQTTQMSLTTRQRGGQPSPSRCRRVRWRRVTSERRKNQPWLSVGTCSLKIGPEAVVMVMCQTFQYGYGPAVKPTVVYSDSPGQSVMEREELRLLGLDMMMDQTQTAPRYASRPIWDPNRSTLMSSWLRLDCAQNCLCQCMGGWPNFGLNFGCLKISQFWQEKISKKLDMW